MNNYIVQIIIGIVISGISGIFLMYIKNNMAREYKITDDKLDKITESIEKLAKNYSDLKLELVEKLGGTTLEIALVKAKLEEHEQKIINLERIIDRRKWIKNLQPIVILD